jgi:GTPase
MLIENQHPLNKQVTASILGVPNAGKSSLVNYFLGVDLSIVTDRPQTTRNKLLCVHHINRTEVVFVDTPGLHRASKEMNRRMNEQAVESVKGADINLILINPQGDSVHEGVTDQLRVLKAHLPAEMSKVWIVFTRRDNFNPVAVSEVPTPSMEDVFREIFPTYEKFFWISSKDGGGIKELESALEKAAVSAPHLFTRDELSNKNMRFFASEFIREQVFLLLNEEVPYEIAVMIDEFKEPTAKEIARGAKPISHISASILVNRPSQKAIVIGSKGQRIKDIGTNARKKIEDLMGQQVHLNLHVKVTPQWFKNNKILEELGLPRSAATPRSWKQSTPEAAGSEGAHS